VANHRQVSAVQGLGDPVMHAQVREAANRMGGELCTEDRVVAYLPPGGSDGECEFAGRLIRSELALIADGVDPLRVSLRIAVMTGARGALEGRAAIRELSEAPASSSGSTSTSSNQIRRVRLAHCARAGSTRRGRAEARK
jgi:hypothetical protein